MDKSRVKFMIDREKKRIKFFISDEDLTDIAKRGLEKKLSSEEIARRMATVLTKAMDEVAKTVKIDLREYRPEFEVVSKKKLEEIF